MDNQGRNNKPSSIKKKISTVFFLSMLLITVTFIIVIIGLTRLTRSSFKNGSMEESSNIEALSTAVLTQMAEETINMTTRVEAMMLNNLMKQLSGHVSMLGEYAYSVLTSPEDYGSKFIPTPAELDPNEVGTQILFSEGISPSNRDALAKGYLLGNMAEFMESLYRTGWLNSCLVAAPEGVTLITDSLPQEKVTADGSVVSFTATKRPWYTGAVEKGGIYFTDVEKDFFSDSIGIVCSMPVYVNGKLAVVVGADLFLDMIEDEVSEFDKSNSFMFLINQNGHVIFSPKESGVLSAKVSSDATDLRTLGNDFSLFVTDVLNGREDYAVVDLDGESYYMVGRKMASIGWAVISAVDVASVEQPSKDMQASLAEISEYTINEISSILRTFGILGISIILVISAVGLAISLTVSGKVVNPLKKMTNKIKTLKGDSFDFLMEDSYLTNDEIEILARAFEDLSSKTKKYISQITAITAEKERIGAELNVATQIQADMLPSIFPPYPQKTEIDLYATMTPAKEVGGDFYDFFLTDANHLALVMADVSGKGVPAALFMVIAKTLLKNRAVMGGTPAEILEDVNNHLCDGNKTQFFVTAWMAIIDLRTGEGIAANAGHEHPALRRAGKKYELVRYKHSPVLGMMEGIIFQEHEFKLNPGDSLFVYTDGVPEATDSKNRLFGEERMVDALNVDPDALPSEVIRNVRSGIDGFVAGAEQFDDITMLCFKYKGNKEDVDMEELEVEAKVENLDQVLAFVDSRLEARDCPEGYKMNIDIAVEEIFVNIASYAYDGEPGKAWIRLGFEEYPHTMILTFIDKGKPFDPVSKPDPDVTLSAEERKIGGLGIFMVKKSMDTMEYSRSEDRNILTITKKI
ncbi:MAG: SpoIIE family protein phosphatase [Spirochaetales bacterium]|nr:SpoIIE family protein phosphatase [Spirochaetales bacterium]